ncbi:hypothetical protein [Novipirellula caenicola]|uniref:Uncharacterized protein n=1 Tax=Novipirellula caenicola TaxID=1536901 RepID=A0ABP9VS86_9BACT
MKTLCYILMLLTGIAVPSCMNTLATAGTPQEAACRLNASDDSRERRSTATYVAIPGLPQCLVTTYHSVRRLPNIEIQFGNRGDNIKIEEIVDGWYRSASHDWAAFRLTDEGARLLQSKGKKPLTKTAMRIPGQYVAIAGNPTVRVLGKDSTPFNYVTGGVFNGVFPFSETIGNEYLSRDHDGDPLVSLLEADEVVYGFSGGPICSTSSNFLSDCQLVGILQGGDPIVGNDGQPVGSRKCWGVPSESIVGELRTSAEWGTFPPSQWSPRIFLANAFADTDRLINRNYPLLFESGKIAINRKSLRQFMTTTVAIDASGKITGSTTLEVGSFAGFRGKVAIVVTDGIGRVLHRSPEGHEYGHQLVRYENGKLIREATRKESWEESMNADLVNEVRRVRIIQEDSPKSLAEILGEAVTTVEGNGIKIPVFKELELALPPSR